MLAASGGLKRRSPKTWSLKRESFVAGMTAGVRMRSIDFFYVLIFRQPMATTHSTQHTDLTFFCVVQWHIMRVRVKETNVHLRECAGCSCICTTCVRVRVLLCIYVLKTCLVYAPKSCNMCLCVVMGAYVHPWTHYNRVHLLAHAYTHAYTHTQTPTYLHTSIQAYMYSHTWGKHTQ